MSTLTREVTLMEQFLIGAVFTAMSLGLVAIFALSVWAAFEEQD